MSKVDTGDRIAAVEGRTGAGRSRLIDSLRRAVPNLVVVEPPPLSDGDAVFHALAQLAVAVGRAGEAYESGARSVRDRAHRVGTCLAEGDRLVVLRLPSSWNALDASAGHDQPLGASQPVVHGRLAAHYEKLDGQGSITHLDGPRAVSWLEKVHHLAHSGAATAVKWAAQARDARELYRDRGRALSLEMERYDEAADVYRECVQRFADDAYAWHYLGFNLDRAGIAPLEAEAAFREAATLEPDNRWWHSRLVTFLVEQARYDDAEAAIRAALDMLDPEGARARTDVQLVLDFHRWAVTAWLDAGEIARARRVFDLVRGEGGEAPPELRDLGWRLADAEEAWLRPWPRLSPGVSPRTAALGTLLSDA